MARAEIRIKWCYIDCDVDFPEGDESRCGAACYRHTRFDHSFKKSVSCLIDIRESNLRPNYTYKSIPGEICAMPQFCPID